MANIDYVNKAIPCFQSITFLTLKVNWNKTKVKSVQLGKPPTEPRVLRKVCLVVEVPEIIGGGSRIYMVCKPTLVFSLRLNQAEQWQEDRQIGTQEKLSMLLLKLILSTKKFKWFNLIIILDTSELAWQQIHCWYNSSVCWAHV